MAIGTHFAARLATKLGMLAAADAERIVRVARALGLAVLRPGFDVARALELMKKDKKATGGALRLVLPRGVGRVEVVSGVAEDVVRRELEAFAALA